MVDQIRAALEPIDEVRVAYFFGSRAGGRPHPGSDLDVAVSLTRGADAHAVEKRVYDALAHALGALGERADVLDLAQCGSAIAFKVLREGRRVLARSESERIALESRIMRRYDDDAPHRRLFQDAAKGLVK